MADKDVNVRIEPENQEPEPAGEEVVLEKETPGREDSDKKPEYAAQTEFQKAVARLRWQERQLERDRKEIDELKNRFSNLTLAQAEPPATVEEDEIDKLANQDWKKAVELLAERKIEEIAQRQRADEQQNLSIQELEQSKTRVRSKYPSIDHEESEEAKVYMEVLNENPGLLRNVYGPELAMYKMEERMRSQGRVPEEVKPIIDKELARRSRVQATSLPGGRPASKPNTYVLTREQKEYCDFHNISYDQYARTAKNLESGESLEA